MIIRKPKLKDIPQLESLFQVTRRHTFFSRPKDEVQIDDYQDLTVGEEVWLAEENKTILGFVSAYLDTGFIHNLFVHPDHQNKGIGSRLLKKMETRLTRPMTLKVAMDNMGVISFYEKHGWYVVSEQPDDHCVLCRKD